MSTGATSRPARPIWQASSRTADGPRSVSGAPCGVVRLASKLHWRRRAGRTEHRIAEHRPAGARSSCEAFAARGAAPIIRISCAHGQHALRLPEAPGAGPRRTETVTAGRGSRLRCRRGCRFRHLRRAIARWARVGAKRARRSRMISRLRPRTATGSISNGWRHAAERIAATISARGSAGPIPILRNHVSGRHVLG